jgi:L-amino acid N-acyltransferase YncA
MPITILPAAQHHLEGIMEIVNYNILNTTALYEYAPRSLAAMMDWFEERQQGSWPVFVAEQNGTVIGYGTYGTFKFKEAFKYTVEHSVYVSHEHIGKGIGRLLLTQLIAQAKQQGFHTMIGCIDADNNSSINFHRQFGFIDAGILQQVGYKFDRWLNLQFMQLILK